MAPHTLPPELYRWQNLRFITKRGSNEWSAECPRCGDIGHRGPGQPDRFRMWGGYRARGWCRRAGCGYFAWADEQYNKRKLSPGELDSILKERRHRIERETERIERKIESLREQSYWRGYHDAMNDAARHLWEKAGIPRAEQDWWELGYNPAYTTDTFTSPALTIPYFQRGEFINLQSRLLAPPKPNDKYRWMAGLPVSPFFPDKDEMPRGSTILVEGAKKAMVVYLHLGHKVDSVVGLPGKTPNDRDLSYLWDCDPVYIMLDPDAREEAAVIARKMGAERCRVVTIPEKPDDYIVKYKATGEQVWGYINHARPVS